MWGGGGRGRTAARGQRSRGADALLWLAVLPMLAVLSGCLLASRWALLLHGFLGSDAERGGAQSKDET